MFPSVKSRFATAARRGFDLAIEFATLGEYGLAATEEPAAVGAAERAASRYAARRAQRSRAATAVVAVGGVGVGGGAAGAPLGPRRLRPATAAARRLQPLASTRTPSGARGGARERRAPA